MCLCVLCVCCACLSANLVSCCCACAGEAGDNKEKKEGEEKEEEKKKGEGGKCLGRRVCVCCACAVRVLCVFLFLPFLSCCGACAGGEGGGVAESGEKEEEKEKEKEKKKGDGGKCWGWACLLYMLFDLCDMLLVTDLIEPSQWRAEEFVIPRKEREVVVLLDTDEKDKDGDKDKVCAVCVLCCMYVSYANGCVLQKREREDEPDDSAIRKVCPALCAPSRLPCQTGEMVHKGYVKEVRMCLVLCVLCFVLTMCVCTAFQGGQDEGDPRREGGEEGEGEEGEGEEGEGEEGEEGE